MLHHNIWLLCTFLQPQSLRFLKISTAQICDGERVNQLNYIHVLLLMLTRQVWPF